MCIIGIVRDQVKINKNLLKTHILNHQLIMKSKYKFVNSFVRYDPC